MAKREDFWISRTGGGSYRAHHTAPTHYDDVLERWWSIYSIPSVVCSAAGRLLAPGLLPKECRAFTATPGDTYYWDPEG